MPYLTQAQLDKLTDSNGEPLKIGDSFTVTQYWPNGEVYEVSFPFTIEEEEDYYKDGTVAAIRDHCANVCMCDLRQEHEKIFIENSKKILLTTQEEI